MFVDKWLRLLLTTSTTCKFSVEFVLIFCSGLDADRNQC